MEGVGASSRLPHLSDRDILEGQALNLVGTDYAITSGATDEYNCVAWVLRDIRNWWEPGLDGARWPPELGDDESLESFVACFARAGFIGCPGSDLEDGYEKIAIYVRDGEFKHVAFQRTDGAWSSKLGPRNDIRHGELTWLDGMSPVVGYGEALLFMRRPREVHPLADSDGLLLP